MTERHDFTNTVVAILDRNAEKEQALLELEDAGYEFEVLRGEPGREHVDPASDEDGLIESLKRTLSSFGDEARVITYLDEALEEGDTVLSVSASDDRAPGAVEILRARGGQYIWHFGEWAFKEMGP